MDDPAELPVDGPPAGDDAIAEEDLLFGNEDPRYVGVLAAMHRHLRPNTYLEIGTANGLSLSLAACPSLCIDPHFNLTNRDALKDKSVVHLYQMTSDKFFSNFDPRAIFGRRHVDFVFLDGLHLYEVLLRDFANVEKCCARSSVVAIHDCFPPFVDAARRHLGDPVRDPRRRAMWAGDVFKTACILRKHRPDLKMYNVAAAPTGLLIITDLDPDSRLLSDSYFDLVSEYAGLGVREGWEYLSTSIPRVRPSAFCTRDAMSQLVSMF